MRNRLTIILLLLTIGSAFGQSKINKDLSIYKISAKTYANPKSRFYNPEEALKIYTKGAEEGNAEAMNGLGMLYMKGIGVAEDYGKALEWFEKGAALNYASAWYNAGLIYKNGLATEQNFVKTIEYFSKSAELNYPPGQYGLGYMYYKGLGIQQDYKKAFELFQKGAPRGSTGSMYMLGLCYRNGYGTKVNTDSARYWLTKIAEKGDKRAIAELEEPEPENSFELKKQETSLASIPSTEQTFRKISQQVSKGEIAGLYTGYIIHYDWSGKHIIGQSELTLSLEGKDKILKGQWIEANTAATTVQAELTDSALVFRNTVYAKTDHYHKILPRELEFRDARLQLVRRGDSVYLAGNLQLYSIEDREPFKPTYISLMRKPAVIPIPSQFAAAPNAKTNNDMIRPALEEASQLEGIKIYPNPFSKSFRVNFNLKQAGKVWLYLSSMNGSLVYQEIIELPAGNHSREIATDIPAGGYAFRIQYGKEVHSSVVIKE